MKKIYFLMTLLFLSMGVVKAQTNFKLQIDMSSVGFPPVAYGNIVETPIAATDWGKVPGTWTNIGGHVYEVAIASVWNTGDPYDFGIRYWDGTTTIFNDIPDECSAGSPRNYEAYNGFIPAEGSVIRYILDGCQVSTYESGSWDTMPENYYYLIINDDLIIDTDLQTTGLSVIPNKSLTIAGNSTLIVNGKVDDSALETSIDDIDFEDSSLLGASSAGDVSIQELSISSTEGAGGSSKSLRIERKLEDSGSSIGVEIVMANVLDPGNYTFSFWAKVSDGTAWVEHYIRRDGWQQNDGNANPTLGTTWTEYTRNVDVTSTGDWVVDLRIRGGQGLKDYFVDNLKVVKNEIGVGNITVESGASLITHESDANDTPVTIKRNTRYSDGKYSFVGSPVASDASITGASLGTTTYWYDETAAFSAAGGARWQDASAEMLVPGVGYAQAFQEEISFTGIPNDGDIVVAGLTYSAGSNADEQGWNLISNPYPAAIDIEAFLQENAVSNTFINNAVYLWDDGGSDAGTASNSDYLTVSTIGSVTGSNGGSFNGYIGATQGFFVKVASMGTVDVTFTEDMRVSGNNADANFFRKADENPLNIKLAIESESLGFYNELLVGLREDASLGVDRIYDADKLIGNDDLQFYSLIDDYRYAIQGLPLEAGVSTELVFNLGTASDLKLSVVELTGLEDGMTFFLYDKETGETYDLSAVESFDFAATKGSDQNRFTLTYGSANVLSNVSQFDQPVYRYLNNELNVSFNKALQIEGFAVYDLSGKVLLENDNQINITKTLNIPIHNKGINVVKIVTSEGSFTRKFLF
ncbi:MAG: T9SS type A sorting domain-containing protein [Cyclobacteriaceae bacterium]